MRVIIYTGSRENEVQRSRKIILDDGWYYKNSAGSHYHYKHPVKKGKVTIPFTRKDLHPDTVKSILKQAGLK